MPLYTAAPQPSTTTGTSSADRESATEQIGHVLDLFSSEWLTNEARSFELDTDIDRFAVARLGLFSACWLSRSSSAEILDVHEANLIYLDREKIKPLLEEMVILLRSTVTEHQTIPGWVWVKSLNEDDIVKNLRNFVVYGRSTGVRKEALSLLADLKVPLAVGVIEGFNFTDTLVAESDKDVAAAACDYLGTVGAEDILPLLESIEGSQAQLLRLRILMRTRPDEAVREVDDVKGNSDKVRAAVEEQIGTLEEKSVRRLLSSARADIRCTALKELATRSVLIEAVSRPDEKSRFRRLKIPHPGCGGGFVDHHRVAKHGASRGSGGGQCWRATRQGIPGRKLIETMSAGSGGRDRSRLLFRCPTPIGSIDLPMPEKTHLPLPPLLRPGLAASAASTVGRSPD